MPVTPYSRSRRNLTGVLAACLLALGCATPTDPATTRRPTPRAKAPAGPLAPAASPATVADAGVIAEKAPAPEPARGYFGRVVGPDGKPAAGVTVVAHLLSNQGGGLLSNQGGGLVSNHSGGLVSNHSGGLAGGRVGPYRLLTADTRRTETGPDGTFSFTLPEGVKANLEARQSDTMKAILGDITRASSGFEMRLAPTGAISGKVAVPADSAVTNLQGVSVYIPGTSYVAIAGKDGAFVLDQVPVGVYKLWAEKVGLGEALSEAVEVKSNEQAPVGEFVLKVQPVEVTSVEPEIAMEGGTVTIKGGNFGKSRGAPFKLSLGGTEVLKTEVQSDTEASFVVAVDARGPLVVEVAGVKSRLVPLNVAKRWEVTLPAEPLVVGRPQVLKPVAYDVQDKTFKGKTLVPTWRVTAGSAVVKIDARGEVVPLAPGAATVEATYQGWTATIPLQVVAQEAATEPKLGGRVVRTLPALTQAVADAEGTIYLTAANDSRVLTVGTSGEVKLLAGNGMSEVKDAQGLLAAFETPTGLALDPAGKRLLVGDYNRIRAVALPGALVTTLAGPARYLYETLEDKDGVGPAAGINAPDALALGADGVLWFLNEGKLRKLEPSGMVSTVVAASGLQTLLATPDGALFGVTREGVVSVQPGGARPLITPQVPALQWPAGGRPSAVPAGGLARDGAGNFYLVVDWGVLKLDATSGQVTVLAGASGADAQVDGSLATARFKDLRAVTLDAPRNRLLLVEENALRELDLTAGLVRTLVHRGGEMTTIEAVAPADAAPGSGDSAEPETLQ